MTTTKNTPLNSSYLTPPKPSGACNICKRLLYSFEEILVCRSCHGSYHWRCMKPETIIHYGENENYICEKCKGAIIANTSLSSPSSSSSTTTTTTAMTNGYSRYANGGIKIKSPESLITNYRDFVNIPSKSNSTETSVINAIRYFEEKQHQIQPHKTSRVPELNGYLPLPRNEKEYHGQNGQYHDGSIITESIQQQKHNEIEGDNEEDISAMFQANYQYTPLKEYAAARSGYRTADQNSNSHQNLSDDGEARAVTSRYGGGLRYTNYGFDPTVARLVEAPTNNPMQYASATPTNETMDVRSRHFVSTTNLNVHEKDLRSQRLSGEEVEQERNNYPSLSTTHRTSQNIEEDLSVPVLSSAKHWSEQNDYMSTYMKADSSSFLAQSRAQYQSDDKEDVERKLSNLVQQLGKQLEIDAQKVNEKLEAKLKNLEEMINQQTYVIRQQDEVIERLKTKIQKIETERDDFRDRLVVHEQREQDEKAILTSNTARTSNTKLDDTDQTGKTTENSNTPTASTDTKLSTKKTPAPRLDSHPLPTAEPDNQPNSSKSWKSAPINRDQNASELSSAKTASADDKTGASNRLDSIIHQKNTQESAQQSSSRYGLAQIRRHDQPRTRPPVTMEKQNVISTVHHSDDPKENTKTPLKRESSISSLSSSSSSASEVLSSSKPNQQKSDPSKRSSPSPQPRSMPTKAANRNLNQSLETLTNSRYPESKSANKMASRDFGSEPVNSDDAESIYLTPFEGTSPAAQTEAIIKGWLTKKNLDSIFKRKKDYFAVLQNTSLYLYEKDSDKTPEKVINLRGAKVAQFGDSKNGPSLELTWSTGSKVIKHYNLYTKTADEASHWLDCLEQVLQKFAESPWRPYHLNA